MRNYIYDCSDYYAKIFIFVRSSRIDKSRLTDGFGKSCLTINFMFCKDDDYPPIDTKILQFILSEPPDEVKKSVNKSL